MTTLRKDNGRIRGIATGDVFRRLVTRALAQQYAEALSAATAPFQFALSTRAGTDCAALLLRAMLDQDTDAVVVSIDGVGAYDHVSRAAIFEKLYAEPRLRDLIPFVRLWYGRQSTYLWQDEAGNVRRVSQGEGVEQGDALAPALFALAIHDALAAASARLQDDEFLVAFLDDVYIKTTRGRARTAFDIVTQSLLGRAQIDTNLGKCGMYGRRDAPAPDDVRNLGADVWRSDAPPEQRGLKILGTPVGSGEFVQAHLNARLQDEQVLLDRLSAVPDPQCAWLVLMYCASPRANHLLRTIPPGEVRHYAEDHDRRIWETLRHIMGSPSLEDGTTTNARRLATLPRRHGGLGLQCASRASPGAFWAAWADALHMLHLRRPREAQQLVDLLSGQVIGRAGCVAAAEDAARALEREGFRRPTWEGLRRGARNPQTERDRDDDAEPGEWKHGWQFSACSQRNIHFREHVLLPSLAPAERAMLRSSSGPQAGAWLQALPTCAGTRFAPSSFQIALRRRLRIPLPLGPRTCGQAAGHGCSGQLDPLGDHLAACPRTGHLPRRANPIERAWTRIAREAGARVAHKQLLRDTNVPISNQLDQRQLDLVIYGIDPQGLPLCCDATMVSALDRRGPPSRARPTTTAQPSPEPNAVRKDATPSCSAAPTASSSSSRAR